MSFLIENAPDYIQLKFVRAMKSLACSPRHDPQNTRYEYFGPFPNSFLLEWPRSRSDVILAARGGWQYLIEDGQGFAVMDLSNDIEGSFSRVRRGKFAAAYHSALSAMQRHSNDREDRVVVQMLEIPAAFTTTMVLRGEELDLFPVSIRGYRSTSDHMNFDDFKALSAKYSGSSPSP